MKFLITFIFSLLCLNIGIAAEGTESINRLNGVFNPQDLLDLKSKKFVEVDSGYSSSSYKRYGWIIEDNITEFLLLTWKGDVTTLRYPAENEKQPVDIEIDDLLHNQSAKNKPNHPVAWNIKEADYSKKINQFIIDGLPAEEQSENNEFGMYTEIRNRFNLADYTVEAAQHAYFSFQMGHQIHAIQLYGLALRGYNKYDKKYSVGMDQPRPELHEFVANRIATRWLNGLYYSAHYGESRQDLMEQWEPLSHIKFHKYQDEAKAKINQYQDLIEEDKIWMEPSPQQFAKYSVEQKAKYWLYHLRDHDAGQSSDPGTCSVIYLQPNFELDGTITERVNAAQELTKLGIEAIPFIIEHLDDPRPTRSKGHWRSYWPEGHYLLTYGDCCEQIFEHITNFQLHDGKYPIRDNAGKQCKIRAEKWWATHQKSLRTK